MILKQLANKFFPTEMSGYKEQKLFKQIKEFYARKDYKSALIGTDKILKTKRDVGEILALKALLLNLMDRNSEAFDCARIGVENNNQSIFCLTILGLVFQSDFDYERAIETIQSALQMDPVNIELLHCHSILQAQMQNLSVFVECRHHILALEPDNGFHHIACAVSHHLNKDCIKAIDILNDYQKSPVDGYSLEHEEILLYKISLFEETGNFSEALGELLNNKSNIVDCVAFMEQHASLLVKLNMLNEAKEIYTELLSRNISSSAIKDAGFEKDDTNEQVCVFGMEYTCPTYELNCGDNYFQLGDLGPSLINYLHVLKYYRELTEDLFDFNTYRSNAYFKKLRYHEQLDPGLYFLKAAAGVVRCYMELFDSSIKLPYPKTIQETTTSRVSNSEKLKTTKSRKKGKAHVKELADRDEHRASKSSDPIIAKLLQVENPLLEATKYLKLLQNGFPGSFETHVLRFELSMRKEEIVNAYKALTELVRLKRDDPDTLRCSVRFYGKLDSMVLHEHVRADLAHPLRILHEESLIQLIEKFHEENKDSSIHGVAAAEMSYYLQPYKTSAIMEFIIKAMNSARVDRKLSLKNCITMHKLMKSVGGANKAREVENLGRQLFPLASYFSSIAKEEISSDVKECQEWLFDSGSSINCTNDDRHYLTQRTEIGSAVGANGKAVLYSKVGSVQMQSQSSGKSYLHLKVAHIHTCSGNIVSVSKFLEGEKCVVQFFPEGFVVKDERYISMVPPEFILARGPMLAVGMYKFISKFPDENEDKSKWYFDTGASRHLTNDESILLGGSTKDCEITMTSVDGVPESYSKKGSYELTFEESKFLLKDVYISSGGVNSGRVNLISVAAFTRDNECSVVFTHDHYYILDAKNDKLLKPELTFDYGTMKRDVYFFN